MSQTLQITDGTNTCDLLAGYFQLVDAGWETEASTQPVWETFTCIAQTTDANIRAEQIKLDKLKEQALRYLYDRKEQTPVVLKVASEGESSKQAFVLDIQAKYSSDSNISPLLGANSSDGNTVVTLTLGVLRTPYYEQDAAFATVTASSVSIDGGTWSPVTLQGSMDQRIKNFIISNYSYDSLPYNGDPLTKLWIGLRRTREGVTHFNPTCEAEDQSRFNDTSIVVNAGASGGNVVRTSFATVTDLAERLRMSVASFTTYSTEMIGEYLVLGRITLDDYTTEVHLQLKQGYMGYGSLAAISGDTYLSAVNDNGLADNWNLIELGHIQIPAVGVRDGIGTDDALARYSISIWAERLSAAGTIDIDMIILIPTDGFAYVSEAIVGEDPDNPGTTDDVRIYTSPLNEQYGLGSVLSDSWFASINVSLANWFYPFDGGIFVIAGQRDDGHYLGFTVDLSMTLVPRWPVFRG